MKLRLLGLHKNKVKSFTKKIQFSYEQELTRLQIEITEARRRRDDLRLTLEALGRERQQQIEPDAEISPAVESDAAFIDQEEIRSELQEQVRLELKQELREVIRKELEDELRRELSNKSKPVAAPIEPKTGKLLHFNHSGSKQRLTAKFVPEEHLKSSDKVSLAPAVPVLKEQARAIGTGFWENIDSLLEQGSTDTGHSHIISEVYSGSYAPVVPSVSREPYFEVSAAPAIHEMAVGIEAPPAPKPQQAAVQQPAKQQEMTPPKIEETEPPAPVPAPKSAQSPAISDEIRMIRQKYIVGKQAGEDVYDRQGKLIIAKHSVISGEVVDRAEVEGKLAELIVNMIIPGLGDE